MFPILMSYWNAVCVALASIVIIASLNPSLKRYWIALLSFTIICVGFASISLFLMLSGKALSDFFCNRCLSGYVNFVPFGVFFIYSYAALSLYPIVPIRIGSKVMLLMTILAVAFIVVTFVSDALRQQPYTQKDPNYYGNLVIYYLLLWLRVHDLRVAVNK